MNQQENKPKTQKSDRFVWVAYSDLSTVLMFCFIMVFIVLAVSNQKKSAESKKLKEEAASTIRGKKKLLDKLENIIKMVKESPRCKGTLWEINRDRNAVQVSFKKGNVRKQWFQSGDDKLTPSGRKCLTLFAKRWLSTIYLSPLKSKISQLIVEGHTDSQRIMKDECLDRNHTGNKNFLCNLELSQKRSLNTVRVIFEKVTIDRFRGSKIAHNWSDFLNWRRQRLTATGRSFAEPIYLKNSSGKNTNIEDKNRSRRVEFRFSIKGIIDSKKATKKKAKKKVTRRKAIK